MRHPHRSLALIPLLAAALAACDQGTETPTGTRAHPGESGLAPLLAAGADGIPGRYIVVLHGEQSSAAAALARDVASAHGARVHHTYRSALNGFAATLSPAAVDALRRNPRVKYLAEDATTHPDQVTQPGATWGLDRVDQRDLPLTGTYQYGSTGAGVRVYVIDSGIRTSHAEFGGRASVGTDFLGDGQNGQDCSGHGTHVAGTIAGATYGVAKAAQVIAVRVFPCSGGTATSTVIAAVDWVRLNAVKPAVVNYSGGGSFNTAHNEAVQSLIASGVTYVTAAGNNNIDACNRSPASTPEAITVGATASNDARASFSNWGTCVDLFAPGQAITSAWYDGDSATATINGTSMAAPHVAGAAALFLEDSAAATPATVTASILTSTTSARLTDVGTGSPNRLLYSLLVAAPPTAGLGLNPAALEFTVVNTVDGTEAAAGAPTAVQDAPAQAFTAAGTGERKSGTAGGGAQAAATSAGPALTSGVIVSNLGWSPMTWSATDNQPWLAVDPSAGTINGGYTARMNATVDATGLAGGTHTGVVTVASPQAANSPVTLAVTLNVVPALSLAVGAPRTGQSGAGDSQTYYVVTVPPGAASLRVLTSGGTGDVDLYVRYGDVPTLEEYDCRPYIGGNLESCQLNNPLPGPYYVMLHGFASYAGVTLSATSGGTPAAPQALAAQPASPTSIRLTWTDASVNETGFTVGRRALSSTGTWGAWADVDSAAANAVTVTNTGLTAGITYEYRLQACNDAGCSAWIQSGPVAIPTAPPAPPFNAVAAAAPGTGVGLSWTDGSSSETSFNASRALRNLDGSWGAYASLRTVGANRTSLTDAGVTGGREYRYQVRACNPAGCSAWAPSNVVAVPTVPAAPTAITGTVLSGTSIRVQWTDGSPNEASFTVSRAAVSSTGVVGEYADVATLAPDQVQFTDGGLMPGGRYKYRVLACNLAGCSAWVVSNMVMIPRVPAAPSSVGTSGSPGALSLVWTDPGTVETSFEVQGAMRNLNGTWPPFAAVATLPANTTTHTLTGLVSGRVYRYQVRACNVSGCSAYTASPDIAG